MKLEQFAQRLRQAATDPPRLPRITFRPGRETPFTARQRARTVERARRQLADEARRRLTG